MALIDFLNNLRNPLQNAYQLTPRTFTFNIIGNCTLVLGMVRRWAVFQVWWEKVCLDKKGVLLKSGIDLHISGMSVN
jgi:hypothetical protein